MAPIIRITVDQQNTDQLNLEKINTMDIVNGTFDTDLTGWIVLEGCPSAPKYSGEDVTLKATPRNGIGPYYVVFRKDGADIDSLRLGGDNPIIDAPENVDIIRVYTLDDTDIRTASTGAINFSVHIEDKCPTGPQSCTEICTITLGCVAPVCNFTVT